MRLLLILSLLSGTALATTYYVNPTGSGTACTSGSPCTVATAQGKAVGGDTIVFQTGTYGAITISTSGRSGSKIVYQGFDVGQSCPSTADSDANSRGARPAPTAVVGGFTLNASFITIDCFKGVQTDLVTINNVVSFDDIKDSFMDGFISASCWDPATGTTHTNSGCPSGNGSLVTISNQAGPSFPNNIYIGFNFSRGGSMFALLAGVNNLTLEFNESERPMTAGDGDHFQIWGDSHIIRYNYLWGSVFSDATGAHTDCWQSFEAAPAIGTGWTNVQLLNNVCMNTDEGVITDSSNAEVVGPFTAVNNIFAHNRLNGGFQGGGGIYTARTTGTTLFEHNVVDGYTLSVECNGSFGGGTYGAAIVHNNITLNGGTFAPSRTTCPASSSPSADNVANPATSSFVNYTYTVPGFSFDQSGNYRLASGASTLINKGVVLSPVVATDLDGFTRTNPPDVGSYEFGNPCTTNWCELTSPPTGPSLTVSSLNFGNQNINTTSSAQTSVVSNVGNATATLSSIVIGGTNASDFAQTSTTCGATLAAGSSCNVSITFKPPATGSRSGTLTVTDTPDSVSGQGSLSGTGVDPTAINIVQTQACGPQTFPGTCGITASLAGDLIAVSCNSYNSAGSTSGISSITDNANGGSNVYAKVANARHTNTAGGANAWGDVWYATNVRVGATILTISTTTSQTDDCYIWEISNVTHPDVAGNLSSQPAALSAPSPTLTTTVSKDILIETIHPNGGSTEAIVSPFVLDSTNDAMGWGHQIVSAAGSYAATWTQGTSTSYGSSGVAFTGGTTSQPSPAIFNRKVRKMLQPKAQ